MPSLKSGNFDLRKAQAVGDRVVDVLKPYCDKILICGSIRRQRPLVGDVDIIIAGIHAGFVDAVHNIPCGEVVSTKFSFTLDKIPIDILIVEPNAWGAAMMHSTGPFQENIRLRAIAKRKHWRLSQYGLFDSDIPNSGNRIAGATEEEVYRTLGVPFVPPEERDFALENFYKGRKENG